MFDTMVEHYSALCIRYGPYIGLYVHVKSLSCVQLFVTPQTVARQAPLSMGSLGWEDPLEKGKAIHSSTLAWRIP